MWDGIKYASATALLIITTSCGEHKKENVKRTPETRHEQLFQEFQEAHNVTGIEGIIARSNAYNNIGEYYTEQERYEEATNCYKQSMNIGGKTPEAYQGLARIQYLKGDKTYAIHLARKAIELDPEYTPAKELIERLMKEKK